MPTLELLQKLQALDTPTICNAIELFGIRSRTEGYMDGRIKANFPEMPALVGYASTATFRASGWPLEGVNRYPDVGAQLERFGELSGPAVMVFQDLDDPPVGATFGENMCMAYQAYGSVGLITSGAGRDLDQVRAIGYPVFTGSTICSHGYCHTPEFHIPIQVGGLLIYPDDLLHADCNGVTTIPKEIASEVADASVEFAAAEYEFQAAIRGVNLSLAQFHEAREHLKSRIGELRARVARPA